MSLLKLTNKYDKSVEQNEQNQSESAVRTSDQHVFILSANDVNKTEQAIFTSLHTSTKNIDSAFTQTKLNKLPISRDNTNRFLKGNLSTLLSRVSIEYICHCFRSLGQVYCEILAKERDQSRITVANK